jgi:hypothetical protein
MLGVIEKMRELRKKLNDLLSSTQGWVQLAAIASTKLLPSPATEPEKP